MRRLAPTLITATTALVVALGGTAAAATPIGLGVGDTSPRLAVDATGHGHLTWAANDVLHYCGLDPGASACSTTKSFPQITTFSHDEGNAPLLNGSGQTLVLSDRFGTTQDKFLYTSANAFSSALTVGLSAPDFTDALYVPAGTIAAADRIITVEGTPVTGGGELQATGSGSSTSGAFSLSNGDSTAAESVALQGSSLIAAYVDISTPQNTLFWRRYSGDGSLSSLNNSANWSAPASFGPADDNVQLASGPGGLFAAYDDAQTDAVMLVRFTGSGWSAPVPLTDPGVPNGWFALSEDAAGVLHLAWNDHSGALLYRYGRDASNGDFTRPQTLVADGSFRDPRLGVDAAGNGWVSWQDFSGSYPYPDDVLPIAPGEPAAVVPPAPPTPPAPSSPLPTPPTPGAGGSSAAPPYAGADHAVSSSIGGGLAVTLKLPATCLRPRQAFRVYVGTRIKHKVAHGKHLAVTRVVFGLDGHPLATVRKKPFDLLIATLGGTAKSRHKVSAKVTVRVRRAHHRTRKVTKTITGTIALC